MWLLLLVVWSAPGLVSSQQVTASPSLDAAGPCVGVAANLSQVPPTVLSIVQVYGTYQRVLTWGFSLCQAKQLYTCTDPPAFVTCAQPGNLSNCFRSFTTYTKPWQPMTVGPRGITAQLRETVERWNSNASTMDVNVQCDPLVDGIESAGQIFVEDIPGNDLDWTWTVNLKSKHACGVPAGALDRPCSGVAEILNRVPAEVLTIDETYKGTRATNEYAVNLCQLEQPLTCSDPAGYLTVASHTPPGGGNTSSAKGGECLQSFRTYDSRWALPPRASSSDPFRLLARLKESSHHTNGAFSYMDISIACDQTVDGVRATRAVTAKDVPGNANSFEWSLELSTRFICAPSSSNGNEAPPPTDQRGGAAVVAAAVLASLLAATIAAGAAGFLIRRHRRVTRSRAALQLLGDEPAVNMHPTPQKHVEAGQRNCNNSG